MITACRALDESRGAIRVEDVYDTDLDDLWAACTSPDRLARWIAVVSGDLEPGGTIQATFTSTWSGPATIEVCEPPHRLLVRTEPGTDDEGEIEAWLSPDGDRTRLVVEERGLPIGRLNLHAAGWQAHLEDLGTSLATGTGVHPDGWSDRAPAAGWRRRWTDLVASVQETPAQDATVEESALEDSSVEQASR